MSHHSASDPDALSATAWYHTSRETVDFRPLESDHTVDLAIIGAGILGLSAALSAAERGLSVVVLDHDDIGAGASGRNGGLVVPSLARIGPADAVRKLGETAGNRLIKGIVGGGRRVFDLIDRHAIACDAVPAGWLNPAHGPAKVDALKARLSVWQGAGSPAAWLDGDETRKRIGSTTFHGAIFDPTGGHLNPLAYTRGLARAGRDAGATIAVQTPVMDVSRSSSGGSARWTLATPGGHVTAPLVIQATNAAPVTAGTVPPAGRTARNVIPLNVYQMATFPLPDALRASILPGNESMADTRNNLFAIRFDRDGRLMIGGLVAVTEAFGAARIDRYNRARLRRLFPQLPADIAFEYLWRGRASLTGDFLPRLWRLADHWLAPVTCNGRGIVLSTVMGEALGQYAANRDPDVLPAPITEPHAIAAHAVASLIPPLLLPFGIAADRRAEG